jgi:integrase/recombinase XerD
MADIEIVNQNKGNLTFSSQRVKRDLVSYWDSNYINNSINNCSNYKDKMFLKFLWMSGVRITEAINLTKGDIDFANYCMVVRWLKSRKYKQRVVPIHPKLKDILEVYTATLRSDEVIFNFSRQRGWQITMKYLGGNPHKFRHSFAINWLRNGGDLVILHKILGHSKIQTTMEYLNIVPLDQSKELNKIKFE